MVNDTAGKFSLVGQRRHKKISLTYDSALLRPWQQQGEQLGAAFAVDHAVDQVWPEAALEGDHRLLLVGDVVTKALEREQEPRVRPIGIDQVTRRARQSEPPLGERVPRE